MYENIAHRKRVKAAVMLGIIGMLGIAALMTIFSNLPRDTVTIGLATCLILAFPCVIVAVSQLIYVVRLKRFADSLDETLDHYLRKSFHRISGKYYWYTDYFLDLTRFRKIGYDEIKSLKIGLISAGIGRIRILGISHVLIPMWESYRIKIRYGHRSVVISTGDNEKYCRRVIRIFTKKNNNIIVKEGLSLSRY